MQQFQNQKKMSQVGHHHAISQIVLPTPEESDQIARKFVCNLGVNTPNNRQNEVNRRKNVSNSISILEKYSQKSQSQF